MKKVDGQRVVVLSRNYSTGLSVIRSLGSAGFTVDLVASAFKENNSEMAAASKYVHDAVEVVSKKVKDGGDSELLEELLLYAGRYEEKPVLFPTDDYTATIMDMNRSLLSDIFLMPEIVGGTDGSMTYRMDKTVQAELAKQAGLLTPKAWIVSLRETIVTIPEDVVYPCFVKPIESVTGYKREMARCENEEELSLHLADLQKKFANRDILIQEFLEIENEIDIGGVCFDQEIILPAIIRKTHVAQYEKGVTLAGIVTPAEELGDLLPRIKDMLRLYHYYGMFDMELNIVGDKIYFNEVNLRSGGPNYSYFMSGVNLPALFCKDILGIPYTEEETKVTEYGKDFIYEKVAWDDYIHGFMTKEELDKSIEDAAITLLYNDEDPEPAEIFLEEMELEAAKVRIKESVRGVADTAKKAVGAAKPVGEWLMGYPQTKKENRQSGDASQPRVLIVGRDSAANLGLARMFGAAGYDADVLRIFPSRIKVMDLKAQLKLEIHSKYVRSYNHFRYNETEDIVNELMALAQDGVTRLLIPADMVASRVAADHYDTLKGTFLLPWGRDSAAEAAFLTDRLLQRKAAEEAGLSVLPAERIRTFNREADIPESQAYPCIISLRRDTDRAALGGMECYNEDDLLKTLRRWSAKRDVEVLATPRTEVIKRHLLTGFGDGRNVDFIGLITMAESDRRVSGDIWAGEAGPVPDLPWVRCAKAMAEAIKTTGLFEIELTEDRDGSVRFEEWRGYLQGASFGLLDEMPDLAEVWMDRSRGDDTLRMPELPPISGGIAVDETVLLDAVSTGSLSSAVAKTYEDTARYFAVSDAEDEEPYKALRRMNYLGGAKRGAMGVIGQARDLQGQIQGLPQMKESNRRDPKAKKPRALVVGRNYCSILCMVRSLGLAGYDSEVVRIYRTKPRKKDLMRQLRPEAFSKYVKAYHVLVTNRKDRTMVDGLKEIAGQDKMLLIPVDDLVADVTDNNYNELSNYFWLQNIHEEQGAISRMMEKGIQKELARKAGLPVLNSCVITTHDGQFEIPDSVTYPCYIKPNVSKNASKSRMRRCDNEEELRKTLTVWSRSKDIEMLVEDYVKVDTEVSLLGLSTPEATVGPGVFYGIKGGQKEHVGVAMTGKMVSPEEMQPLVDDTLRFIHDMGFTGLYDIDYIRTSDGTIYFVEMNMRYGASGYGVTLSGANLPGMYADYMVFGKPVDKDCAIEPGQIFVSEKVLIDEYSYGRIPFEVIDESMKEATIHFIFDEDDPKPYAHFKKFYAAATVIREKRRIDAARKEVKKRRKR